MIRLSMVRTMLFEEVAQLRSGDAPDGELAALEKARGRATVVALFDWFAILVLFGLRDRGVEFLDLAASEQGLFTLAVLVVATHAGFRFAQRQKIDAVIRLWRELPTPGGESI